MNKRRLICSFKITTQTIKIVNAFRVITSLNFPVLFQYNVPIDFYQKNISFNIGRFERWIKFSNEIMSSGQGASESFLTTNSYFIPRRLFDPKKGQLYGASYFIKKNINELIEIFYIMCDIFELENNVKVEKQIDNFIQFANFIDLNKINNLDNVRSLKWEQINSISKIEKKVMDYNFISGR